MSQGTETLKRTPLHDRHIAAGARLVPYAGWEMPVQYAGIREEHRIVRNAVGIFDVSHMGEIETEGPGAEAFLQHVLSNDVTKIAQDGAQYSVLCNESGGVLDDLFTYRLGHDRFLTVTNAANHQKDLAWFQRHAASFDVRVHDRLTDYAMLAIQGPEARALVEGIAEGELPKRFRTAHLKVAGADALVAGTGYTGEDGVELLVDPGVAPADMGRRHRSGSVPRRPRRAETPSDSRSASTSTATTCPRTAARSRPASAGAARRTRTSSARTSSGPPARTGRPRSSSRSCSPAPGSPARATPSRAVASSRAAR